MTLFGSMVITPPGLKRYSSSRALLGPAAKMMLLASPSIMIDPGAAPWMTSFPALRSLISSIRPDGTLNAVTAYFPNAASGGFYGKFDADGGRASPDP